MSDSEDSCNEANSWWQQCSHFFSRRNMMKLFTIVKLKTVIMMRLICPGDFHLRENQHLYCAKIMMMVSKDTSLSWCKLCWRHELGQFWLKSEINGGLKSEIDVGKTIWNICNMIALVASPSPRLNFSVLSECRIKSFQTFANYLSKEAFTSICISYIL